MVFMLTWLISVPLVISKSSWERFSPLDGSWTLNLKSFGILCQASTVIYYKNQGTSIYKQPNQIP